MLRHQLDEPLIGLVAREAGDPNRSIACAQNVSRARPQQAEDVPQLIDGERVFSILSVLERNVVVFEQGDRLAARTSGAGTDER